MQTLINPTPTQRKATSILLSMCDNPNGVEYTLEADGESISLQYYDATDTLHVFRLGYRGKIYAVTKKDRFTAEMANERVLLAKKAKRLTQDLYAVPLDSKFAKLDSMYLFVYGKDVALSLASHHSARFIVKAYTQNHVITLLMPKSFTESFLALVPIHERFA